MSKHTPATNKITIRTLIQKKAKGEKITCLTAYDWLLATILDQTGIDLVLVGDSASNVFAGYDTTIPITMDQMLYHTQCVSRGVKHALLISDMPFLSYQTSLETAVTNAGRFMKEGGSEGVKMEGGEPIAETVHRLVSIGIPVMGHLGLTPQSIKQFGGYRLQGKDTIDAERMIADAKILEQAGAFAIVLEKIPADLGGKISESITIPTIGIGAGPKCDGQVLVTYDMLGMFEEFKPKFVRHYAQIGQAMREAVQHYIEDIRSGKFPSEKESY